MRNQTSKNAVLAMLAASILTDKEVIIRQCPKITDVDNMAKILVELGCKVKWEGDSLVIDCSSAHRQIPPQPGKGASLLPYFHAGSYSGKVSQG